MRSASWPETMTAETPFRARRPATRHTAQACALRPTDRRRARRRWPWSAPRTKPTTRPTPAPATPRPSGPTRSERPAHRTPSPGRAPPPPQPRPAAMPAGSRRPVRRPRRRSRPLRPAVSPRPNRLQRGTADGRHSAQPPPGVPQRHAQKLDVADLLIGDFLSRPLTDHVADTRYQRGNQREQRRDIHLRDGDPPPPASITPITPIVTVTVPGCAMSPYGPSDGGIDLLSTRQTGLRIDSEVTKSGDPQRPNSTSAAAGGKLCWPVVAKMPAHSSPSCLNTVVAG